MSVTFRNSTSNRASKRLINSALKHEFSSNYNATYKFNINPPQLFANLRHAKTLVESQVQEPEQKSINNRAS